MRWRASHVRQTSLPSAPLVSLAAACLLALSSVACGPAKEAEDPSAALWTEVQQLHTELAQARSEIADMETQLASAAEAAEGTEPTEPAEGEELPAAENLQAKIDAARDQTVKQAEDFYQKVIQYINESGIIEGQPLSPEQRQAFDWKADEDIRIAQEYIDKGGDYSRAIDIYNGSLMADPENQALLDAKAEAERLQYMDEERFAKVAKGMSQDQVQALLGTVNARNVREYQEDNTVGWFYRREDGGAAGVFFKQKQDEWIVAVVDYNAAKPPAVAEGESADEGE